MLSGDGCVAGRRNRFRYVGSGRHCGFAVAVRGDGFCLGDFLAVGSVAGLALAAGLVAMLERGPVRIFRSWLN